MRTVAYHRTSTTRQHTDRGEIEIRRYCKEHNIQLFRDMVFIDQQTGKNFNRENYKIVKYLLEPGDCLIITEIDRLGRNKKETMREILEMRDNDIRLMVLELPTTLMDLSKFNNDMAKMMMETINNMMVELYVSMAEAELKKKEKRQREGIEAKKLRGEWDDYGRPAVTTLDDFIKKYDQIIQLEHLRRTEQLSQNPSITFSPLTTTSIMKQMGLQKTSFYKYKKAYVNTGKCIDSKYPDIVVNNEEANIERYKQFKKKYPKLLKEKKKRESNKKFKAMTITEMLTELGLSAPTFYRYRERYEEELLSMAQSKNLE